MNCLLGLQRCDESVLLHKTTVDILDTCGESPEQEGSQIKDFNKWYLWLLVRLAFSNRQRKGGVRLGPGASVWIFIQAGQWYWTNGQELVLFLQRRNSTLPATDLALAIHFLERNKIAKGILQKASTARSLSMCSYELKHVLFLFLISGQLS